MDLLGDIVEHDTQTPVLPVAPGPASQEGFPTPSLKKPSRWRQRLQNKGLTSMSGAVQPDPKQDSKFYTTDKSTNLKKFKNSDDLKLDYSNLSEAEHIHQENIEVLSRMSVQEREEAKGELLDTLDPKILEMLIRRSAKKYGPPTNSFDSIKNSIYDPVEGSIGTWVGGEHELDFKKEETTRPAAQPKSVSSSAGSISSSTSLKSVLKPSNVSSSSSNDEKKIRFSKEAKVIYLDQSKKVRQDIPSDPDADEWEDVKDVKESSPTPIIPQSPIDDDAEPTLSDAIKIKNTKTEDVIHDHSNSSGIHFPKPTQPYEELDINDPKFNDKLYEKYFPDLPKNPQQLEWMKPIDNDQIPSEIEYDSIESVRFDFNGNIITSENISKYINSDNDQGLFNHSQHPELPGYTLPELAHYLRSTFPGQVCIACRTLGRIFYKLGKFQYQVNEIDENSGESELNDEGLEGQFEIECWKLISTLQIITFLQKYSSDNEKNLSIKNYSIDALWLWKSADGDKKLKQFGSSTQ